MKFNFLILIFFLLSCTSNYTKTDNRKPYNSTGFALVYNESDYVAGIIKNKLNNELLHISHQDLKTGTLIKLINPKTKEYLVLKNIKKNKYPDFYKILLTRSVANKLNIEDELPLIEILEIKKNKSFIAKKAKIFQEEKTISANAPVTSVQIDNISKKKNIIKKNKNEKIYIIVASFYSIDAAKLLKKRITDELIDYDHYKLKIKKKKI